MHHTQTQLMVARIHGIVRSLRLPSPDVDVLPGVPWGRFDRLLTPAFWAGRVWLVEGSGGYARHRLGRTLREEVAACLLGGYGVPAEIGLAAFARLRSIGALVGSPTETELCRLLLEPLVLGQRSVRYRFARQKARYLALSLAKLGDGASAPTDDRLLRDYLSQLPGIGLKTASWITRNWTGSDSVAILDVHICRACAAVGAFPPDADPSRQYLVLERRFLNFASGLGVRASLLDDVMWQTMRRLPRPQLVGMASAPDGWSPDSRPVLAI